MTTIADMINMLPSDYSIYVYNNSRFNSPINVLPDDPYEDDVCYILLPPGLDPPRSESEIYTCVLHHGAYFSQFN